jgi:hypothetical protein
VEGFVETLVVVVVVVVCPCVAVELLLLILPAVVVVLPGLFCRPLVVDELDGGSVS